MSALRNNGGGRVSKRNRGIQLIFCISRFYLKGGGKKAIIDTRKQNEKYKEETMTTKRFHQMPARILALVLTAGMILPATPGMNAEAASKLSLTTKKVSIKVGKSKKISIKNAKKMKVKKTKWSIDKKKVATVKKSGKYAARVTAKKKGKATLTCKCKRGNQWTRLKCSITVVTKKEEGQDPSSSAPAATSEASQKPEEMSTAAPSDAPVPVTTGKPQETSSAPPKATPKETPKATPAVKPDQTPAPTPTVTPTKNPDFTSKEFLKADFEGGTDGFVGRGGAETLSSVDGGHDGKCLRVTGRTADWNGARYDVTSTIVKGADYKFSAWVRQDSGKEATVKLSATLNNAQYPCVQEVSCKSGEWTLLEGTYTVPRSFQSLDFYFEGPGGNHDIYIDQVRITQESEGAASVDPMSFASLKDAYKDIFQNFGTCLSYNTPWNNGLQMQNAAIMKFVQKQFNSFTLENELKPDQICSQWGGTISVAEAKKRGYVIPSSYKETVVPSLEFKNVDKAIEIANQYGIRMRAHVLLWHQQTNLAFFKENYSMNGATIKDTAVMDARNEFYVKTVMKHVMEKEKSLSKEPGSIVYCWDVANEYIHRKNNPNVPSWADVYGDMGLQPVYVKNAFRYAYEMLKEYGLEKTVTLFYNDYNEYDCADEIVQLVNYINQGEEAKICGGIGMQSHITTTYPSLEKYGEALDQFMATGLEVQVTELDMGIEQEDDESVQAEKYEAIMKLLVQKHKNRDTSVNPKGITGVTIWGLLDTDSWRKDSKPILFGSGIDDPKPCFYSVLEAAKE